MIPMAKRNILISLSGALPQTLELAGQTLTRTMAVAYSSKAPEIALSAATTCGQHIHRSESLATAGLAARGIEQTAA